MKYIIIGDIHGRTNWKEIINYEKDYDKVIFQGDYFDPYENYSLEHIIKNFLEIYNFKLENPDKIILLIGNHDLRAFNESANECRYIKGTFEEVNDIFNNGIKSGLFQLCYFIDNKIICSHAGFSKTWLKNNKLSLDEKLLNNHFKEELSYLDISKYDFIIYSHFQSTSGDDKFQSPLWIRPNSLVLDYPDDYIQCVGHTSLDENHNRKELLKLYKIICNDGLEYDRYTVYNNGEFYFKKLNNIDEAEELYEELNNISRT